MAHLSSANLDFELAYLARLTRHGLKPLSRWEKAFEPSTEDQLRALGLRVRVIERSVQTGRQLRELLFSNSEDCLELYARRFDRSPVEHSVGTIRLEGLLFGYPSCCVEHYTARGYAKNALRRRDQRILFHWACPHCALTPLLVPDYQRIYRMCRRTQRGSAGLLTPIFQESARASHLRRSVALAASLVALGTVPLLGQSAAETPHPLDPHVLALAPADDPDQDFLTTGEETILGMSPQVPDADGNSIPDGIDLAHELSAAIDALPTEPSATRPYVTHHGMWGLETCNVCGQEVNMGFMEITNPLENQRASVQYMAKHFLEHGGLTYDGSLHSGRLNPALLKMVVASDGHGHFIAEPPGTDGDQDGLRQWEEPAFGTDPEQPDTNGDHLTDGSNTARELRRQLDALPRVPMLESPYVVEHPMDGIEICPRCGERVVMDIWDVIHPVTHDSISIPSMALHYLDHGGIGWQGGQLLGGQGRVDPRQLQAVLTGQPNQHLLPAAPDADRDELTDAEERELGKDAADPDEDHNAVRDGLDLARQVACEIAGLSTSISPSQVYRLDFPLRGLERCDFCGTNVNMGHLTVCNPMAQLYAEVPYITLHYLEHDSFSFAGDVHGTGRTDVKRLLDALHSPGPGHLLPVPGDGDADGLKDPEELHFGTLVDNPDTNGDGVLDGVALARQMHARIMRLPDGPSANGIFVTHYSANCFAPCPVCGVDINCGHLEITNVWTEMSLTLSYLNAHYLERGSFAASPTERVDPVRLEAILRPAVCLTCGEHDATVRWPGKAGRTYQVYSAPAITGPWTSGPIFHGDGREVVFQEDREANVPGKFYKVVVW